MEDQYIQNMLVSLAVTAMDGPPSRKSLEDLQSFLVERISSTKDLTELPKFLLLISELVNPMASPSLIEEIKKLRKDISTEKNDSSLVTLIQRITEVKTELRDDYQRLRDENTLLKRDLAEVGSKLEATTSQLQNLRSDRKIDSRNVAVALLSLILAVLLAAGLAFAITQLPLPPTGVTVRLDFGTLVGALLAGVGAAAAGVSYGIKAIRESKKTGRDPD